MNEVSDFLLGRIGQKVLMKTRPDETVYVGTLTNVGEEWILITDVARLATQKEFDFRFPCQFLATNTFTHVYARNPDGTFGGGEL